MVVLSCCLGCTCSDRERPVVLSVLPVLVRGSLPCLWVRLVCVWPDALLGLPTLGRERMVICSVLTFQLVLALRWLFLAVAAPLPCFTELSESLLYVSRFAVAGVFCTLACCNVKCVKFVLYFLVCLCCLC